MLVYEKTEIYLHRMPRRIEKSRHFVRRSCSRVKFCVVRMRNAKLSNRLKVTHNLRGCPSEKKCALAVLK